MVSLKSNLVFIMSLFSTLVSVFSEGVIELNKCLHSMKIFCNASKDTELVEVTSNDCAKGAILAYQLDYPVKTLGYKVQDQVNEYFKSFILNYIVFQEEIDTHENFCEAMVQQDISRSTSSIVQTSRRGVSPRSRRVHDQQESSSNARHSTSSKRATAPIKQRMNDQQESSSFSNKPSRLRTLSPFKRGEKEQEEVSPTSNKPSIFRSLSPFKRRPNQQEEAPYNSKTDQIYNCLAQLMEFPTDYSLLRYAFNNINYTA